MALEDTLLKDELWDWLIVDRDRARKFFESIDWPEGEHYCLSSYRYYRLTGLHVIAQSSIRNVMAQVERYCSDVE
jgi:hypothetical protein